MHRHTLVVHVFKGQLLRRQAAQPLSNRLGSTPLHVKVFLISFTWCQIHLHGFLCVCLQAAQQLFNRLWAPHQQALEQEALQGPARLQVCGGVGLWVWVSMGVVVWRAGCRDLRGCRYVRGYVWACVGVGW